MNRDRMPPPDRDGPLSADREPPDAAAAASRGSGRNGGRAPGHGSTSAPAAARGADLARAALEAARATNAARRKAAGGRPARRRGDANALRRRRWSGPGPDARDPQPLGATLRSWVRSAGVGADLTKATIFARWPELVGSEVADHCVPVSLRDGELVVQAESTAWATQIRVVAPHIVRRLNDEVGAGSVARIRARGPAGPSWRFGPRHVPGRGPRDTYG